MSLTEKRESFVDTIAKKSISPGPAKHVASITSLNFLSKSPGSRSRLWDNLINLKIANGRNIIIVRSILAYTEPSARVKHQACKSNLCWINWRAGNTKVFEVPSGEVTIAWIGFSWTDCRAGIVRLSLWQIQTIARRAIFEPISLKKNQEFWGEGVSTCWYMAYVWKSQGKWAH